MFDYGGGWGLDLRVFRLEGCTYKNRKDGRFECVREGGLRLRGEGGGA